MIGTQRLAGLRIVCLDDNPKSLNKLVMIFENLGASAKVYADPVQADREIQRQMPDAIISDITRGDDLDGGFDHVARLRAYGYDGPVVFFTARVTPERRQRAMQLGAIDIVTSEDRVINALRKVAWVPLSSRGRD
jgi:CheY-like chemotaxis protein